MTDILKDQVVIVFGGTGIVGPHICKLFAAEGAKVVVHYHNRSEKANSIVESIIKNQGKAIALQGDLNDEEAVQSILAETVNNFGRIDVVVNTVHKKYPRKFVADMKWEDWDIHLQGLKVHFNICKNVVPYMRKQHGGRIIFISGGMCFRFFKGCSAYTAIKAGLNGFCKALALEEGKNGITVNIVAPGKVIEEENASSMPDKEVSKGIEQEHLSKVPLGRWATGYDVANAVLYFASPLAAFMTGQTLFVSGGELMPMP